MSDAEELVSHLLRDFESLGWVGDTLISSVRTSFQTVVARKTASISLSPSTRDGKLSVLAFPWYESEGRNILESLGWTSLSPTGMRGLTPALFVKELTELIDSSFARRLYLATA